MAKKLAYTIVDSGYVDGAVGDVDITGSTVTPSPDQVTGLNGDPKVVSFLDASSPPQLRTIVSETGTNSFTIYDTSWNVVAGPVTWSAIDNIYGAVKVGSYLYAIDFTGANVAKISLTGGSPYTQVGSYTYTGAPSGYNAHGVAITEVGDGYIYAVFVVANATFTAYQNSVAVKLNQNGSGSPTLNASITSIRQNAATLTPYGTDLFVACIGGAQSGTTYNASAGLDVVTTTPSFAASQVLTAGVSIPYDFRDITFDSASGNAYLFVGHYSGGFASMVGRLYRSTAANLIAGTIGTNVNSISASGYFWAALYEETAGGSNDRLWFAEGNPINIYQPPPSSAVPPNPTPTASLSPSVLGTSPVNANLNWITPLWEASAYALRAGAAPAAASKSFAVHAGLAREARLAAEALKKKKP